MKTIIRMTTLILIVLIAISIGGCSSCSSCSSCGCGATLSEEEATTIFNTIVNESYELNVIYFGEGLKPQVTDDDSLYVPVQGSENYTAKLPLIERTREIFSSDYASDIIKTAFEGEMGVIGSSAIYARYIEYDGYLSVRTDIKGVEVAKYDYSTTEIIKISNRFIVAKIKTNNLENNEYVEITLINEEDGWRIDSATY